MGDRMAAKYTQSLTGSVTADLGIGMATPGAGNLGGALQDQVKEETDDEKLRRRLGLSATQNGGSLAVQSIFGGIGERNT